MPDGISRVRARVQQIQALLEDAAGTNVEFGAQLDRATEAAAARGPETTDMTGVAPTPHGRTPASLAPLIEEAAGQTGLPQELISAVIAAESGYRPDAVSSAGALGLMQLMPGTARSLGVEDPLDPRQNVLGGSRYLSQQLQQFGSVEKALAAYNAGPHAVQRYGGIPPYPETEHYVRRVMNKLRDLVRRE
jgi:soluble lytic murein transglycosylase-like protein